MAGAKPVVCIVTPGTRGENNGNWRTATRWAAMLREDYRPIVQSAWAGEEAGALIALHARRSAESVARFRREHPGRGVAVVLTGTDLYRDLPDDAAARASLDSAHRIVVLQEDARRRLEPRWRRKCDLIFQSATSIGRRPKARGRLDCVVVGHLREEKDPRTLFEAVRRLPPGLPIHVRHIGAPLDARLAAEARALARHEPRYRYSGALPHGLARAAIARAHVLIHPSLVEGGANVIAEAVVSRTAVIASHISGNLGMLGARYPGYFEVGGAGELAALLVRALEDPRWLERLDAGGSRRRPLFDPRAESRAVRVLAARLLARR